jgi:hypothetical protein
MSETYPPQTPKHKNFDNQHSGNFIPEQRSLHFDTQWLPSAAQYNELLKNGFDPDQLLLINFKTNRK